MNSSYFIGKYCTIITNPINRAFKEEVLLQYFTGIVDSINNEAVYLKQLTGGLMTVIYKSQIIAIAEERLEDDSEKIKEYKTEAAPLNAKVNYAPTPHPVEHKYEATPLSKNATIELQQELNIQAMREASKLLKNYKS